MNSAATIVRNISLFWCRLSATAMDDLPDSTLGEAIFKSKPFVIVPLEKFTANVFISKMPQDALSFGDVYSRSAKEVT